MSRSHSHPHAHGHRSEKNIIIAFWLNTAFALLKIAGGMYTNSVSILSDALHDFGDSLSLGLAYYFQKKSDKKRDENFSYGYKRFSLLGAFINSTVLILGSVFIIREAILRLTNPVQANAKGMLVLAIAGILVNGIAMLRLRSGGSVNERVVSLHFLEDVLGWIAVLIGSVVMLFISVPVLDPVLSLLIAGYILFNVYRNLRQAFQIVLQGVPLNVDVEAIKRKITAIPGITGIHDFHTWTMDGEYNIMTLHIVVRPLTSLPELEILKREVRNQLHPMHVDHLTIEIETEGQPCELRNC